MVQAGDLLGLVRAEVARILGFRCRDISDLYEGRKLLRPDSEAWRRGERFVGFYQALFDAMQGDGPRMVHWFRMHHDALGNSPFHLMIDEGRLEDVLEYLSGEENQWDQSN